MYCVIARSDCNKGRTDQGEGFFWDSNREECILYNLLLEALAKLRSTS